MFTDLEQRTAASMAAIRDRSPGEGWVLAGAPRTTAATAMAKIRAGLAELAAADPDELSADELADAVTGTVEAEQLLAAQQSRLIDRADRREVYRDDACVTTTSWLRFRTRLGYAQAQRRVKRTALLRSMDRMREAFTAGDVTADHVDAIVRRATPQLRAELASHDETLTQLARDADPSAVSVAVRHIIEQAMRDGTDDPPPCSREDLRELHLRQGFDGLGNLDGTATPLLRELLLRVRDVYSRPDPPDTPQDQRRTFSQRFHDALQDALTVALDHHPGASIGGVKTHVVLFADLYTLLGEDELARIAPRLSSGGIIDPEVARHLIATTNPTLRAVLGLGPWMPVGVGRARRVLPDWLRSAAQLSHGHCRGVGCDRPFAWTEADHLTDWALGGETDLANNGPFCDKHHDLKGEDGWKVVFDTRTGVVTWTSADGTKRFELPPPDL